MERLRIENLIKSFGSHKVLDIPSFELDQGLYWIKGGNGTGKTTLFRTISGQTPFKGEISINGVSLKGDPVAYRSMISYAEAEPQFPGYISGSDLLKYYLKVRKGNAKTAAELTERFAMDQFMGNKIGSYSSGMMKKLSLICTLTGDIQLYLLDEPLITIDGAAAAVLYDLISSYAAKGCSFLISSHQEISQELLPVKTSFQIKDTTLIKC